MDPKFLEAWFNADHVVLGRKLYPFSLETALVLSLVDSPFLLGVEPGVEYTLTDLQLAVLICSTPAEVFLNARLGGWWTRFRKVLWSHRCRRMNLHKECQKFVTYVDDFNSAPEAWHDEGDAGDGRLGAPWILANVAFLLRNSTLTERAVWTMPIGKALWYCATISEQLSSKIQILSEEDRLALEELEKCPAK